MRPLCSPAGEGSLEGCKCELHLYVPNEVDLRGISTEADQTSECSHLISIPVLRTLNEIPILSYGEFMCPELAQKLYSLVYRK